MADKKGEKPKRAKDVSREHNHYYEGLSNDLKGFLDEVYTINGGMFKGIRLTSGLRQAKEGSRHSHHHTGDAVDIAAWNNGGKDGQALYEYLMNTKEGLALLNKYGLGVIDETDPEVMKKTGASGPHFHIGKDKNYAPKVTERLGLFESGQQVKPLHSFIALNGDNFDYTDVPGSQERKQAALEMSEQPISTTYGVTVLQGNPERAETFLTELKKSADKEKIKEDKKKKSEARKALEMAQKKESQDFMGLLKSLKDSMTEASRSKKKASNVKDPDYSFEPIGIQTSLPKLQGINRIPKFDK